MGSQSRKAHSLRKEWERLPGELTTELVVAHNLAIQILPANLIGEDVGKDEAGSWGNVVFKEQL